MATAPTALNTHAPTETLDEKFHRLANTWQNAVAHLSSSSKRDNHPAYREIIALGPHVVPCILRDLETTHRHWFAALAALSGENPVPKENARDILKLVEVWLKWGKDKGYQW